MIERIHLAIVRELAQRETLMATAEALHLTQSALSHSVRRLEERLGTPIWSRNGRRLELTQAGQHLLAVAERVLPILEQGEERLAQIAAGRRGRLIIGMECHPCYAWLQAPLGHYLRAWPLVEVDVRQKFQFGGVAALIAGEIDLLVTPDPIVHEALSFEPVFDYEQVLVVAAGHRLAARRRITAQDLREEVLLTYPVPRERLDVFTRFLLPAGVLPRQHRTVEDTEVMLAMVASGRGVTALPRWLLLGRRDRRRYALLRLGAGVRKRIHLGLRSIDRHVPYLNDFLRLARAPVTASRSRATPR